MMKDEPRGACRRVPHPARTGGGDHPPARDIARRAPLLLQAGITGLDLRLGGYVMLAGDSGTTLGQVRSPGLAEADAGEVGLPGDDGADVRTRLRLRLARGDGVILDRAMASFAETYADQNDVDYAALRHAVDAARIAVETGL
jgi:hypothetical protein